MASASSAARCLFLSLACSNCIGRSCAGQQARPELRTAPETIACRCRGLDRGRRRRIP
jgi:hypothetical protein